MRRFFLAFLLLIGAMAAAEDWDQLSDDLRFEQVEFMTSDAPSVERTLAQLPFHETMRPLATPSINLGYFNGTAWIRFHIQTNLPPETRLRVYFDSAFLEDVRLYAFDGQVAEAFGVSGIRYPLSRRALPTRFASFEITAADARQFTWMVSIQSSYPLASALNVQTLDGFHRFDHHMQILVGFFAGAFLVMSVYNLFLYLTLFDPSYLLYSLAIFLTHGMIVLGNFGVVNEYFWPESPWLMKHHYIICEGLALICNAQLARFFFDLKRQTPRFNLVAWGFTGLGIVFSVIPLLSFPTWLPWATNAALGGGMVAIIYFGAYFTRKGNSAARLFLASWSPLLLGGLVVILGLIFSWELMKIFKYVVLIGALFESVLLSLALGYRYRLIMLQKKQVDLQNRSMMNEIESAKEIQDALMPQSFEVPGMRFHHYYRSAERTGGDLYGYFHNKEADVVFAFIGDVTGHGLSSALITSNISGAIYASLRDLQPQNFVQLEDYLVRIAMNVNEELIRVASAQKLATFLMVAFDLRKSEGVQLNAGHLPLLHRDHRKVHTHIAPGSPLGLNPDPRLGCKRFTLQTGDILFLITDGVIEQKELSFKKISRLLEQTTEVAQFHANLEQILSRKEKLDDDATWLLIQWRGSIVT